MKQVLVLLCILCSTLRQGKAEKFEIKTGTFADAWQSSVFRDPKNYCFRNSANNKGHGWRYFHTTDSPDSSGYQWLLLKLNSGIRVVSVTVHGRKEVPVRAHNVEILLGDRLPNGTETAGTCTPTLTDRLEDFLICGRTRSNNANLTHEVRCNTSICTQIVHYILIRKYVGNETDKYMNFVNLQIEKAPINVTFHACISDGGKLRCNAPGLRSLVPGIKIIVMVCLPCQPILEDESNCSVISPDGTKRFYDMTKARYGTSCLVIFLHSELHIQKHGWHFQCDLHLTSREIFSGAEPLGFIDEFNTEMILSPQNPIKEGSTVSVTLVSSGGRPAVRSFSCWIGDTELRLHYTINTSNATSATFLFNASRNHNQLLLRGKFKQNEQLVKWRTASLIVYFPANKPNMTAISHTLRANSSVEFELHVADFGNPAAILFCFISGRSIRIKKQASNTDCLSLWNFNPLVNDNRKVIICHIVQIDLSGVSVYNQTVSSEPLNVTYPSINSWSATQLQEVMEGELLSVAVTSVGGNPLPSHQCWMQSRDDKQILMDSVFKSLSPDDKPRIVSNFSVTSTRHMNRGSIRCRVTQKGQPDMTQQFTQHVSVLYSSTIDLSVLSCNGTHVIGSIFATNGHPPLVNMNCSVSTKVSTIPEVFAMWNKAELMSSKNVILRFTPIKIVNDGFLNISCKYVQENHHTSLFSHSREIKCIVVSSKEESAATNSRDSLLKWTVGAVLTLGIIIAVPLTVYIWKRAGHSVPQGQSDSCREPKGIPLKPVVTVERDPNTEYYYADD